MLFLEQKEFEVEGIEDSPSLFKYRATEEKM